MLKACRAYKFRYWVPSLKLILDDGMDYWDSLRESDELKMQSIPLYTEHDFSPRNLCFSLKSPQQKDGSNYRYVCSA